MLIKTHMAGTFDPTYIDDYRIISIKGNQVQMIPHHGGKSKTVRISGIKYILPVDNVISKIMDHQRFGRKTKLRLNPDHIPYLG